jgi:hypothetical protein
VKRVLLAVALALILAGCSNGYNAGVSQLGAAHLMPEWKKWGAAEALPDSAAPRKLAALGAAVQRSHAQPVSVRMYRLRGGDTAPALILASFTPRTWLKTRALRLLADLQAVVGRSGPYYVGLVDRTGRFLWETGRAMTATGPAGGVYAPQEIDACQPVLHSLPVSVKPPPRCVPD